MNFVLFSKCADYAAFIWHRRKSTTTGVGTLGILPTCGLATNQQRTLDFNYLICKMGTLQDGC